MPKMFKNHDLRRAQRKDRPRRIATSNGRPAYEVYEGFKPKPSQQENKDG